jgi:hypothetical protein
MLVKTFPQKAAQNQAEKQEKGPHNRVSLCS